MNNEDPESITTMKIIKRVGEQYEFKENWRMMLNAERNDLCGDIYNIIDEMRPLITDRMITTLIDEMVWLDGYGEKDGKPLVSLKDVFQKLESFREKKY
jgi:hypothetical protein